VVGHVSALLPVRQWMLVMLVFPVQGLMKASAFDNACGSQKWKKPLRDNDLTDSIEVKS
jgi:hypothetical protein